MPEWQLSRLNAQHLLEPAPNDLIARQSIGTFGRRVQIFVDERAILVARNNVSQSGEF